MNQVIEVPAGDPVDDRTIAFPVRGARAPARSAFFVGIAKSGSTLLHRLVEDLCALGDHRLINVADTCFRAGIPERRAPDAVIPGLIDAETAFFYGFRCVGRLIEARSFRIGTKIGMVRDPRDAVTSLYFSVRESHSLPEAGETARIIADQRDRAATMDIDAFVQGGHGDFILRALAEMHGAAWLPWFNLYRYEDVIFDKAAWIPDLCRAAGLQPPDRAGLDRLLDRHDLRPDREDPGAHVRQVAPGNHRKHLSQASLDYIAGRAGPAMRAFGYE